MSSRRIVLFDIDGTLMRGAGPQHKDALIEGARSVLGVPCTLEGVDTAGCLDRDLIRLILANAGVGKRRTEQHLRLMVEAAQHHYVVNCKADFSDKLCPGVTSALRMLAGKGIPLGLVTGNLSAIAWRKLENAGIANYFSFGAFAEEAHTRTRLAKIALHKARRRDLAAWNCSATLIGDHANDIEAAQANGFRSIAVATGVMPLEELHSYKPDLVLNSLEELSYDLL